MIIRQTSDLKFKTKIRTQSNKKKIVYSFVNNHVTIYHFPFDCVNTHDFYLNELVQFISDIILYNLQFMIII